MFKMKESHSQDIVKYILPVIEVTKVNEKYFYFSKRMTIGDIILPLTKAFENLRYIHIEMQPLVNVN